MDPDGGHWVTIALTHMAALNGDIGQERGQGGSGGWRDDEE